MPRDKSHTIRELPNVGIAIEKDLALLGITSPDDLVGKDPYQMYSDLCNMTGKRHDPCVIDIFISIVRYMDGEPARKWWEYTEERKNRLRSL